MTHTDFETRYASTLELDGRKLIGFPVVFSSQSLPIQAPSGGFTFREIVSPEAVDRTLREGIDVRALVNHEPGKVIGRMRAGTLQLTKDRTGLRAVIEPDAEISYVRDVMRSVSRGDITGMSFRFQTMPDGDEWRRVDGEVIRTLHDIRISEISVVGQPAYPDAEVAMRSLAVFQESEYRPSLAMLQRLHRQRML